MNNVHPRIDEIIQRVINEERIARRKARGYIERTDDATQSQTVTATDQLDKPVQPLSEM
ncbi:hypothetical protein ACFVWF_32295 [Rhodococcus qingshengii]|uniref:hypothetical protein n=1 Tax=Rhodococcus qingshengii TaxID=334542 RepID=UPI0036D8C270